MRLYVLDTDTLTLWTHGHPRVTERISEHNPAELCTTIITIEEILRGWYTLIRRAKTDEQIARAYAALQQTIELAAWLPTLGFDQSSVRRFNKLRRLKLRVGSNDLKIAAIVLENQATVVTRNQSDFEMIPGLTLEDWSS